ncbi:MAG: hypothetical protein WC331_11605 [Candidatus Omnitrophota bacterium]|jgi:hypothetical protein
MVKNQQGEFTKMLPERSDLGKAAIAYIAACDEEDKVKLVKESAKESLINEFIASGKTSIKVNRITVSFSHLETNKVSVRQEKEI